MKLVVGLFSKGPTSRFTSRAEQGGTKAKAGMDERDLGRDKKKRLQTLLSCPNPSRCVSPGIAQCPLIDLREKQTVSVKHFCYIIVAY